MKPPSKERTGKQKMRYVDVLKDARVDGLLEKDTVDRFWKTIRYGDSQTENPTDEKRRILRNIPRSVRFHNIYVTNTRVEASFYGYSLKLDTFPISSCILLLSLSLTPPRHPLFAAVVPVPFPHHPNRPYGAHTLAIRRIFSRFPFGVCGILFSFFSRISCREITQ